jgi:small subunit ribosomal protein S12
MSKLQKLIKNTRLPKLKTNKCGVVLGYKPQKKVVCFKVLTISPKKPNSANRRVFKVQDQKNITVKIPGEKHNLQTHSVVLINGGRSKELVGVYSKAIRGKFDLQAVKNRKTARSLYGVKK